MTTPTAALANPTTTAAAESFRRAGPRWVGLAIGAVIVFISIYLLAVWTVTGQQMENAALRGADQLSADEAAEAGAVLDTITVTSLAVGVAAIALIGLIRRAWVTTMVAVGVVGMGQVITQSLKRFILPRPDLVEASAGYQHNSLPSGHTTIAITVLIAILLVVPYRWRGLAMVIVMTWSVSIGAYTISAKWHRFSDTLAANCVGLLLAAVAGLLLLRWNRIGPATGGRRPLRWIYAVIIGGFGLLAFVAGLILVLATDLTAPDDIAEWNLYLAGHSWAAAGSVLASLLVWWSYRYLEIGPADKKV